MRTLKRLAARLAGWSSRNRHEAELNDEFESHLQMQVDENIRAGMAPDEARRKALAKLGGVESAREAMRDGWTLRWIESVMQDVRLALRGLRRSPGFAAAAILSLTLGLGASLAIFTVADNLLLRPLPYRDPSALMMLWERQFKTPDSFNVISAGNYFDWKARNTVFESVAGFRQERTVFSDGQRVEEIGSQRLTWELLPMLGVRPARGRMFTDSDDRAGHAPVVIISHRLWQSWFGGEESVIGRTVQINSSPRQIIGVMPAEFYFRSLDIDVWTPFLLNPAEDYRRTAGRFMFAVARLKPGKTQEEAASQMKTIAQQLEKDDPWFNKGWTVVTEPLRDSMVRNIKGSLYILLGAVGLLLAVACANVANLLLARYTARQREMAVKAALGAGRARIMRQLLTEAVVLGLSGCLLGLLFARWAVVALLALAPESLSRSAEVVVDLRIVFTGLALSILTGILFGLAPSIMSSRSDLARTLHDGRGTLGSGGSLRGWLVGAEVALSVVLLAGAGLLFRSLVALQSQDPGLKAENVLTFRVSLPKGKYPEAANRSQFFARAIDDLKRMPGVHAVSAVNSLPFGSQPSGTWVYFEGQPRAKAGEELVASIRTIWPGYFEAFSIPVRQGRVFTDADNQESVPLRFIVNEAFVKKVPDGQPLSKRISVLMRDKNPFADIIGVVGDVKEDALDKAPVPTVYYPHAQLNGGGMALIVRSSGDPLALAETARRVIRDIDPAQPVAQMRSMEAVIGETMARSRFSALLLIGFSVVSLLLAAVGVYGILSYSVSQRQREIGLRLALGASPGQVASSVVASGLRYALGGVAVGVAGALALSGFLKALLFTVGERDPVTFTVAPAVLLLVSLFAAYLPARRAAALDPMDALRVE